MKPGEKESKKIKHSVLWCWSLALRHWTLINWHCQQCELQTQQRNVLSGRTEACQRDVFRELVRQKWETERKRMKHEGREWKQKTGPISHVCIDQLRWDFVNRIQVIIVSLTHSSDYPSEGSLTSGRKNSPSHLKQRKHLFFFKSPITLFSLLPSHFHLLLIPSPVVSSPLAPFAPYRRTK